MILYDQERTNQRMERKGREDKGDRSICEVEREMGSVLSHRSNYADRVGGGHRTDNWTEGLIVGQTNVLDSM